MTLFDTDVLVDVLRGDAVAAERLQQSLADGIALSVVSRMELVVGCRDGRELALLRSFLARFETVHVDAATSAQALALVERYRLSHGLRMPDALIAATALVRDLALVSKNQKDFCFIDGLFLPPYPR